MKKAEGAKTAQELKEKYGRKRYNAQNIGIAFTVKYLYKLFLMNEGISYEEQAKEHLQLFSEKAEIKYDKTLSALTDYEEVVFHRYNHILYWIRERFHHAVFVRDSTIKEFLAYRLSLKNKGEELYLNALPLGEKDSNGIVKIKVSSDVLSVFKTSIERNLKYLLMYNSFIDEVAKAINIPELAILKVVMSGVDEQLKATNEMVENVKAEVDKNGSYYDDALFSSVFVGIQQAPPIPNEILKRIENDLKGLLSSDCYLIDACYDNLIACYYENKGIDAYAVG